MMALVLIRLLAVGSSSLLNRFPSYLKVLIDVALLKLYVYLTISEVMLDVIARPSL